ncbi:exocyst complex component EXO70E2-like [Impatiens glandulifera]|uniref:exocyst complex component EXO70E2-like n=1 Tax=Impatiens glandulifera TaxID=253017 RepID=UPI001FB055ED|nr:exocyst complex component EXO70E2-like [Impatiens glandulifera]
MDDSESTSYGGEEHVFAAARYMIKALGASKTINDDVRKLLNDLDSHLSLLTKLPEDDSDETKQLKKRLKSVKERILIWESNKSKIWDLGADKFAEYLQAVQDVRSLTDSLRNLLPNGIIDMEINQSHDVIQLAMLRVEDELVHILTQNRLFLELDCFSPHSFEEETDYEEWTIYNLCEEEELRLADLINPDVVPIIKSIANTMFSSSYDHEFCDAFVAFWKTELEEYLVAFDIGSLTIDELLKMEWLQLISKVKNWIRNLKNIIVFLASSKRLFNLTLGEFGPISGESFIRSSKGSMIFLLNFGVALATYPHEPERLFDILHIYESLANLVHYIDTLFSEPSGALIRTEWNNLLERIGESAKATFMKFNTAVASKTSTTPFPGGGVHHMTKYVTNYINTVTGFSVTLDILLKGDDGQTDLSSHLLALMSTLEMSLEIKSRLYKDSSLKHIFMMNNIHYMVEKVNGKPPLKFLGDEWVKEHTMKFQQHATSYERVTWNRILDLLRVEENMSRKVNLKQRFKEFNDVFDDVYKTQASWLIPNPELRKDLRISISQKVVVAYRGFIGRRLVAEKYIKYKEDDLEDCILNLFEGWAMSMRKSQRRW